MNMGSPDKFSVDNIELNENDGSTFTKVDSNLSERRKGFEGNGHENEASGDRSRMELSPQHHGSSLVQAVARSEELESSYTKSSPQAQCNLYEDIEKTETVEFNRERVHSDHGGETGLTSGEHPDDSSSPTEAGKFHTDIQMDDRAHFLSEFPSKEDSSYPLEDVKKNSPCHEIFLEIPEKVSGNLQLEKSEDVYGVTEEEGTVHLMDKAYGGNWEIEGKDSDVHSLGLSPEMPASPVRETSVSPEQAHNLLGKELSSQNIDGSLCSPKSSRREVSPSPKRTDMDSKIVFSEDHPSPYPRRMSPPIRRSQEESPERTDRDSKIILPEDHPSPRPRQMSLSPNRRSRQESPERTDRDSKAVLSEDHPSPSPSRRSRHESSRRSGSLRNRPSSSPRRRLLSPDRRKPERSLSRSPTRQRGPPYGSRRDYRDRSRSRSPIARDRYRRSPRRYSPRRRSPPGYRSRRRSPRRRPWSPPHSRNNGVGRPGNNLFVAGFSFVTTERDLERKFSRFGRVRDVRIVRDKRSGDSRGFGFLSLERDEDADAAIRALDQTEWNGRVVLVEKSKSR